MVNTSDEELMVFTLFVVESDREEMPPGNIFSVDATIIILHIVGCGDCGMLNGFMKKYFKYEYKSEITQVD